MKTGDRVKRKPVNNFKSMADEIGTIQKINDGKKPTAYILWDRKNTTGQQHSTVQIKFLELATLK